MKRFTFFILAICISFTACNSDAEITPAALDSNCDFVPFYENYDNDSEALLIDCPCQDSLNLSSELLPYTNVWSLNYSCNETQFDQIPAMSSVTHLTSEVMTGNITAFQNLEVFKNRTFMETPLAYQLRYLPNLREITLFNATSFPDIIGDIPLETFKISYNRTPSFPNVIVPSNLYELKNLTELTFKNMDLVILTNYNNLENLEYWKIENTTLARMPSNANQWTKLKTLEMTEVDFRGNLSDVFSDMNSLETIYLSEMEVTATMQERIYKAPNLKELTISYCQISTIPDEIGNLTSLEKLIVTTEQNTINNPIILPLTISNLTNLKSIFVSTNTDEFPMALLGLKNTLESISIQDNIGNIPLDIGDFTVLKTLKLTNCDLTSLPSTIQNLANTLEKLYLAGNSFDEVTKQQIENWLPNTDVYF